MVFTPRQRLWIVAPLLALAVGGSMARDGGFYVGGIQVHEQDHRHWIDSLLAAGMNTVAVTVYAHQGDWDGDDLWYSEEEPAVLDEIRAAKARGLRVVLVLRVAVDHAYERNKFVWHGMIMPASDELIDSWFTKYTRFVIRWARVAETEGVDVLGIGSEMNALTATLPITRWGNERNYWGHYLYERRYRSRARKFAEQIEEQHLWTRGFPNYPTLEGYLEDRYQTKQAWAQQMYLRAGANTLRRINARRERIHGHWLELIEQTRGMYGGLLTYAANFDSYQNVGFWPQLDLLGINGYFPLRGNLEERDDPDGQLEEFTESWKHILERIADFEQSQDVAGMPIVFTEIGYTFRRHSTVEPWSHGGFSVVGWKGRKHQLVVWDEQPIDYAERSLALEGLRRAHESLDSSLTGILYWKLSTDRAHEEIEPFVLHVGADSDDPLQTVLAGFAR
jgi:hypothetical protein